MCVCAALWASKGVAGFMRTRERASKGGGGFIWARNSSPCGAVSSRKRETVRPARSQHPTFGVFVLAGRVFRGRAAGGAVLGELFSCDRVVIAGAGLMLSRRGTVLLHCCPASIVCGNRSQAPQASGRPPDLWRWGFCSIRSWRALYVRRVAALMMQLPPSHVGELVV